MVSANYEADAKVLRNAMKGIGTDEQAIIKLVGNRSNADRQQIIKFYKSSFGEDLCENLRSELGGDLREVVLGMFMTPVEYDAHILYTAMKGVGTDEDALIEVLATRDNSRIKEIREFYKNKYGSDLESDVKSECSGDFGNFLVALLQANRDESDDVDGGLVNQDAKHLYEAGEAILGTEEEEFIRVLTLRSRAHLRELLKCYAKLAGKSLNETIESETSGDLKKVLLTLIHALTDISDYFATRIYNACKGWGTNDKQLIRALVSRDEVDLERIKKIYLQKYGKSLLKEIDSETSGDYKAMLLELAHH